MGSFLYSKGFWNTIFKFLVIYFSLHAMIFNCVPFRESTKSVGTGAETMALKQGTCPGKNRKAELIHSGVHAVHIFRLSCLVPHTPDRHTQSLVQKRYQFQLCQKLYPINFRLKWLKKGQLLYEGEPSPPSPPLNYGLHTHN